MRTSEYQYRKLPFESFNPAQEAAVPFLSEDCNLVIVMATAAGKTALAECVFGYHLQTDPKSKVVYSSPLRAVSSEKHAAWSTDEEFSKYSILINTGDHIAGTSEYDEARLILTTYETLDSKSRRSEHERWMKRVACAVFDEAHFMGSSERGPCIEAALIRLSDINPQMRFVFLSATMSNGRQVAKWVKSLNGKDTKYIKSSWRPRAIDLEIVEVGDEESKEDEAVRMATELLHEKMIIFVHSKASGTRITKELQSKGVKCAFHNASVRASKRSKIERAFSDKFSGMDVIISTSTLGAGVNIG